MFRPKNKTLRRLLARARVSLVRAVRPRGPRRLAVLLLVTAAIGWWQYGFARHEATLDKRYRNLAASGVHQDPRFTYFFYYLDLFPIATSAGNPKLGREHAEDLLKNGKGWLVQDIGWTWSAGDRGKIFLYLFDAYWKGEPRDPTPRTANRVAFTAALMGVFFSCWWLRRPLLGLALVLALGSNPFQLFEVHARDNVHGWTITAAIFMLALHLPILTSRRPGKVYLWLLPVLTGLAIATIRTIRSEPAAMLGAAMLAYLVIVGIDWRRRLAVVGLLLGTFFLAGQGWQAYFRHKHEVARDVLAKVGGHPFPEPIRQHHQFWHPVWCGLGDFDTKYGYFWEDNLALAYAKPILEKKYGQYVPANNFRKDLRPEDYYDEARMYKRLPFDIPHYTEVIREKILTDIKNDPAWYLGILGKRVWRLISETTPLRISFDQRWIPIPMHGLAAVGLALVLILARSWFLLKLLLFTLPTCLSAFLVFSGKGVAYYAIYHLVGAAILAVLVVENVRDSLRRPLGRLVESLRGRFAGIDPSPAPPLGPPPL
jgi:hypothetical protein